MKREKKSDRGGKQNQQSQKQVVLQPQVSLHSRREEKFLDFEVKGKRRKRADQWLRKKLQKKVGGQIITGRW